MYKCREINSKTEKDTQINYKKTQNNNEIKKLLQSDRMTKKSCKTTKKRYKTTFKRLKRATETQNGQKKAQIQKENNHKETINVHGERKIEHLKKMQNVHVEKDAK